jgi:hypothetical protein
MDTFIRQFLNSATEKKNNRSCTYVFFLLCCYITQNVLCQLLHNIREAAGKIYAACCLPPAEVFTGVSHVFNDYMKASLRGTLN